MKLKMTQRAAAKKSDVKRIRREGNIPAVLYSSKRNAEMITVDGVEMATVLRNMLTGKLPTTKFVLGDGKKELHAIIKDIQYHPTTYQVLHIDFEELIPGVPVSLKVPVECTGTAECGGIKLGGFLRQVIRHVRVECVPEKIPSQFEIDVRSLGMRQSKRVSDIQMPEGVRPLARLDEVVVVIAKR